MHDWPLQFCGYQLPLAHTSPDGQLMPTQEAWMHALFSQTAPAPHVVEPQETGAQPPWAQR